MNMGVIPANGVTANFVIKYFPYISQPISRDEKHYTEFCLNDIPSVLQLLLINF